MFFAGVAPRGTVLTSVNGGTQLLLVQPDLETVQAVCTASIFVHLQFLFFLPLIFSSSSVFAVEVAAEVYSMQQGDDGELSQYDALVAALAKFGQGEEVRWHEHTNLRTKKRGGKEQSTKLPCS
jgi:hypothetical protein